MAPDAPPGPPAGGGRSGRARGVGAGPGGLRVLTLPARHAYLDGALPPEARRVAGGRPAGLGWAPDPLWDPAALHAVRGGHDVVHVHFGYDHVPPARLGAWAERVRADGARLVVTVHDLRNPHHDDPAVLAAQLGVLVPAADAVLTLTPGAAAAVADRWGVTPGVAPHPAVHAGPADVAAEPGLVGVHLKSLRRNVVEVDRTVAVVSRAVAAAGGRLEVHAHRDVADRPELRHIAALPEPTTRLVLHDYLDDETLRAWQTRMSVSVMVNRFGTHSGWLEGCHDVGTRVVAPDCGFYAEQWPAAHVYHHDEADGLDPASLATAVSAALAAGPVAPADRDWRTARAAVGHAVHRRAYAA